MFLYVWKCLASIVCFCAIRLYVWIFSHMFVCLDVFFAYVCMFGCFPIFSLVSRLCAPPVERRGSGYLCWATTTPPQPTRYENCPLSFLFLFFYLFICFCYLCWATTTPPQPARALPDMRIVPFHWHHHYNKTLPIGVRIVFICIQFGDELSFCL